MHRGYSARILCVDDEPVALAVRKMLLEHFGFQVFAATSGEEALHIFSTQPLDLVISDHMLQGTLGTKIAASMKAKNAAVPIMILSGATDIPEGMEFADCFLSKLEPPPVLLKTVDGLLNRKMAYPTTGQEAEAS